MFGLSTFRLYVYAGIGVVMLGMVTTILWFRSSAHDAEHKRQIAVAQLGQAVTANETQAKAINALQENKRIDDTVTAQLVQAIGKLDRSNAEVQTKITSLERGSDEIRNFLAASVPSDLANVWNGTTVERAKRDATKRRPAFRFSRKMRKATPER